VAEWLCQWLWRIIFTVGAAVLCRDSDIHPR
jgi:hypothetical protein